jgi:hypothetical protein
MKLVEVKTKTTYVIELEEAEAKWLRAYMQNRRGPTEDPGDTRMREILFTMLNAPEMFE